MKKAKIIGFSPYGCAPDDGVGPFKSLYPTARDLSRTAKIEDLAAVVLWGGRDINPKFYHQKPHKFNQARNDLTIDNRDLFEWNIIKEAVVHQVPIIGVCRGAQMLCAFAGGALYQDVDGHESGAHRMTTAHGKDITTNSYHHQMMDLRNTEHELLAWSNISHRYYGEDEPLAGPIDNREPEVVYFNSVNGFAVQGHPEWMGPTSPFVAYINEQIDAYL